MLTNYAPVLPVVKTHGNLAGKDIVTSARTAKDIAAEIARNPRSKSAQSLAAVELNRSLARGRGEKSSKVVRIERALKAEGVRLSLQDIAGV